MPNVMAKPQHLTDDNRCPYCKTKPRWMVCREHNWAYRKWYEALKAGLENRASYQLKPLRPS